MTKIIPTVDSPVTVALATSSLTLYVQKQEVEAKLKSIGLELVEIARGDTLAISIPGQGKVTVTKPSLPEVLVGQFNYVFSEEMFKNLPASTQKSLIERGVVTKAQKTKGGSTASVRHVPNK